MKTPLLPLLCLLVACKDDKAADSGGTGVEAGITCADVDRTNCVFIEAGDSQGLLDTANLLEDDSAIVLAEGTWVLDNAVTFRSVTGITFIGQGMGKSVLDFGTVANQVNGVDVIVDDFHIEGMTVLDATKDAVRIEDSSDIVIRGVETTWTNEDDPANGAYGIYPVQVERVLMEDNVASNAADAGIYVGQCQHAIVRNNTASGNVAGLEIENTQFADVYGNTVVDNTAGLVVFDLPGNPVIGRDVHIHDNVITDNNRANFAPGGTVAQIPAGTGTFVLASRRVVITGNTYARNNTTDIAVLSGFVVEGDPAQWYTPTEDVVGDISGLELESDKTGYYNYRTLDVWVHGNTHEGSGTEADLSSLKVRPMGFLLGIMYGAETIDTVLYDAIGESSFDVSDPALNSNDNRICVGTDTGLTFASLNLEVVSEEDFPQLSMIYRPDAPFTPFDCTGVEPIAPEVDGK
jgi:parallel beta-helix repeat protein